MRRTALGPDFRGTPSTRISQIKTSKTPTLAGCYVFFTRGENASHLESFGSLSLRHPVRAQKAPRAELSQVRDLRVLTFTAASICDDSMLICGAA